jgi:hypothetical protein
MHRRIAPAALTLAAVFAATGCGGAAPGDSSTQPGTNASSAPATTAAAAKAYSNEDLTSIVSGLKDAQGQSLTVVPAAQIDQGLIAARELLKTAVITPKACAVLADNNSQVPEGSTYAAGASLAAKAKTATIVTVFAVKDPAVMAEQFDKSDGAVDNCSTFTVELEGQKITSEMKPIETDVQADRSLGALTVQTLPTGQKQAMVTVTGVKGTLAATAIKRGAVNAVTAASAPELVQLVNAALAAG